MKSIYKVVIVSLSFFLLAACVKIQLIDGCINTSVASPGLYQNITFTDCTKGAVSSYWDFGDGTSGYGITITKSYTAMGSFTVTVKSTNASGKTKIGAKNMTIGPEPQFPVANLTTNTFCNQDASTFMLVWDTVHFYARNSHASSFFWDFGDGTTSTDSMPTHVFTQSSQSQPIKLRVTNAFGVDSANTRLNIMSPYDQNGLSSSSFFNYYQNISSKVSMIYGPTVNIGDKFDLNNYPFYLSTQYYCYATLATISSGKTFIIQPQTIPIQNSQDATNPLAGTIHGHGYWVGSCASAKLYIIDTLTVSGITYYYNDSLYR